MAADAVVTSPEEGTTAHAPANSGRSRRGWRVPAAVAAVVLVVVLASLFALGVLPGRTAASTSAYLTFSGAESNAQSGAGSVSGGPWYASLAISLISRTPLLEPTENVSGFLTNANCTYDWLHGEPENLAVPQTPLTAANGTSAYWIVGLKNESNGILLETVADGSAQGLVTVRGANCAQVAGYLVEFPSATVDSPAVLAAANSVGGSAFLRAHPNATELWGAVGGINLGFLGATNPEWYVEYTSCTFPAISGETGAFFNATVAGLTGDVISNASGTMACTLGVPGVTSLAPYATGVALAAGKAI
jgi:hypothetical protein